MAVTITPPPTAPTVNSLTKVTGGGTFAAGVYEVAIMAYDIQSTGVNQTLARCSSIYRETFTLAANDSIDYDCSTGAGALEFYILIRHISGTGSYNLWVNATILKSNGVVAHFLNPTPDATFLSGKLTKLYNVSTVWAGNRIQADNWSEKYYGLANDKGDWLLTITYDSNYSYGITYLINDYLAAVASSGMVAGQDYCDWGRAGIVGNFKINTYTTTTYNLVISGLHIYCLGWYNKDSKMILYSRISMATNANTVICMPKHSSIYSPYVFNFDNTSVALENVLFRSPSDWADTGVFMMGKLDSIVNNCVMENITYTGIVGRNPLKFTKNCRLQIANITPDEGDYYENNDVTLSVWVQRYGFKIKDYKIKHRYNGYKMLLYPQFGLTQEYIDCDFYIEKTPSDNDWLNAPRYYDWVMAVGLTYNPNQVYTYTNVGSTNVATVQFKNTCNYTIKDNNNNAVSGVTITCKNKNNEIVYQSTTDASGYSSNEILVYQANTIAGNPAGYLQTVGTATDYNPFSFTIAKEGYNTLTFSKTITNKQTNTFILDVPDIIEVPVYVDVPYPVYYHQDLNGSVFSSEVAGDIYSPSFSGIIENINIKGSIQDETLSGNIFNTQITGDI
jgi:hypothetical protein